MKNRWIVCAAALLIGGGFFVGHVVAQEGEGNGGAMPMMPEWMKKGPEHEALKKYLGEWTVASAWKMPDGSAMTETGTTKAVMFHNSFIRCDYKSGQSMMGEWNGTWFMGFDNASKKYKSVWMDSVSPHMHTSMGEDHDGKLVFHSKGPDHMTGQMKRGMHVMSWTNADEWVLEFFQLGADGAKSMGKMTYTRKK